MFGFENKNKLIEENMKYKLELFRIICETSKVEHGYIDNPKGGVFENTFRMIGITVDKVDYNAFVKQYELLEKQIINMSNK